MSDQNLDRLRAASARLLAAETHLASATDRLLQQRRRALAGNSDEDALAAALAGYLLADAEAQWARSEYERTAGTTASARLAALGTLLEPPAPAAPVPALAPPTPPAAAEVPEPYAPHEPELRRWEFTRWLIAQGKLTEFPA